MMIDALLEDLKPISGATVRPGEPMARHTPLRVGGPADIWTSVADIEALSAVLSASRRHKVPWRICWPLGDWLVRDGGVRGLVVRLGVGFYPERWADTPDAMAQVKAHAEAKIGAMLDQLDAELGRNGGPWIGGAAYGVLDA